MGYGTLVRLRRVQEVGLASCDGAREPGLQQVAVDAGTRALSELDESTANIN